MDRIDPIQCNHFQILIKQEDLVFQIIARPYIDAKKVVPVRVTAKGLHRSLGLSFLEKDVYPDYYTSLIGFLKENMMGTALN